MFIDIDALLRPVYQARPTGCLLRAHQDRGRADPAQGTVPLATTISAAGSAPVIAGVRLRAGRANPGKGAGRMVVQAIGTARAAGASGQISGPW